MSFSPMERSPECEAADFAEQLWEAEILPTLERYIRIPNRSPNFDRGWVAAGHMDRAVELIKSWCEAQAPHIPGLTVEVVRLTNPDGMPRTPVILMEAPGEVDDTVLLYGHLDKQPEMTGWREGLGPWTPVREGDKLYGRGGADDGYAVFAALAALRIIALQNTRRARCVVLIEACEESGSYDLPAYIDHLAEERIGTPSLVVCLDSGCANYDQIWMTTSLRGLVGGTLTVRVLTEGVHSGDGSGIIPSSFRVMRILLNRVEDMDTSHINLPELHTKIPADRRDQAYAVARTLGPEVYSKFPFAGTTQPTSDDLVELVLARTWRPALSVTGAGGLPPLEQAGNVTLPYTTVKLSVRIPPGVSPTEATQALNQALTHDPPYGAEVTFNYGTGSPGWMAPALAPWLATAVNDASNHYFGEPSMAMGEGGSIPFMAMLGKRFPDAQFLITGVLGPSSNAHGPNEFLHIPTAKRLTCCVADVIAAHANRPR